MRYSLVRIPAQKGIALCFSKQHTISQISQNSLWPSNILKSDVIPDFFTQLDVLFNDIALSDYHKGLPFLQQHVWQHSLLRLF